MEKDDQPIADMVKEWFTKTARHEWRRLQRNRYHQIEFIVTMHFLTKYLPKDGLVLDAGGGPGRYTIELAKKGYNMVLLDITPELLKTAKRKIKRAGVQERVKEIKEGSITDLSAFNDETFDAVMCLGGPLCHILDAKQREHAASELVRVTKAGSPLFVSVIGRLGVLRTIFLRLPEEMQDCRHHWETGDYIPGLLPRAEVTGFTAAHWFLPEELLELFERHGVETLDMAALEGLSSHHEGKTNRLAKDEEKWKMWMDIILRTCNHPSIVGGSEHILLVGRKCRKSRLAER